MDLEEHGLWEWGNGLVVLSVYWPQLIVGITLKDGGVSIHFGPFWIFIAPLSEWRESDP